MDDPPASPDLAPCDFFLVGAMKGHFTGQPFDSVDEVFQAVEGFLAGLLRTFAKRSLSNGQGDCRCAWRAAENLLSQHYATVVLLSW
jgi:hypothetical protein